MYSCTCICYVCMEYTRAHESKYALSDSCYIVTCVTVLCCSRKLCTQATSSQIDAINMVLMKVQVEGSTTVLMRPKTNKQLKLAIEDMPARDPVTAIVPYQASHSAAFESDSDIPPKPSHRRESSSETFDFSHSHKPTSWFSRYVASGGTFGGTSTGGRTDSYLMDASAKLKAAMSAPVSFSDSDDTESDTYVPTPKINLRHMFGQEASR